MSRFRSLLAGGALVVLPSWTASRAPAAPITFNTALPVTQGQGVFRLQAVSFEFASDPTPLDQDLSVRAVPLAAVYGVTPHFALFAIAPLLDKELTLDTPLGRRTRGDSGLGDVTLLARYTAYQRDAPGGTFRVAPFVGIETPTGKDDTEDLLGRLPQPLQLGSGSWDPLAGVVLTRQLLGWQLDAALSYQANTEANDFELGDEARLDLSYQHRVWPRELGRGVPAFVYTVIESNLVWRDRHEASGIEVRDSGGTAWFLAPGVQYVRERFVLEGAVQVPVAQDLNGVALETDWIGILSARINL